jgi:hypothetical protein
MATNDYIKNPKTGKMAGSRAGANNIPQPVAELMPHPQTLPEDKGRPYDALDRFVEEHNRRIMAEARKDYAIGDIIVARFNHPAGGDKRDRYQKIERNNGNEYDLACWMNLENKLTYRLDELAEIELVSEDALDRAAEQYNLRLTWKAQNPDAGEIGDFEVTAVEESSADGEHSEYRCGACGSDWIRYEHLDQADCEAKCQNPCTIRCCNEEDCVGEAVLVDNVLIKSVRQLGRTCHNCSCDTSAPCEACVSCLVCNEESNRAVLVENYNKAYVSLRTAIETSNDVNAPELGLAQAEENLRQFDEDMVAHRTETGLTDAEKKQIDDMSLDDMLRKFRFSQAGDAFFRYEADPRLQYFMGVLTLRKHADPAAFTEASKRIGWDGS